MSQDQAAQIGTVKWFNQEKGYGFIKPDGQNKDVFVHLTEVKKSGYKTLAAETRVSYDTEVSPRTKRPGAVRIRIRDKT